MEQLTNTSTSSCDTYLYPSQKVQHMISSSLKSEIQQQQNSENRSFSEVAPSQIKPTKSTHPSSQVFHPSPPSTGSLKNNEHSKSSSPSQITPIISLDEQMDENHKISSDLINQQSNKKQPVMIKSSDSNDFSFDDTSLCIPHKQSQIENVKHKKLHQNIDNYDSNPLKENQIFNANEIFDTKYPTQHQQLSISSLGKENFTPSSEQKQPLPLFSIAQDKNCLNTNVKMPTSNVATFTPKNGTSAAPFTPAKKIMFTYKSQRTRTLPHDSQIIMDESKNFKSHEKSSDNNTNKKKLSLSFRQSSNTPYHMNKRDNNNTPFMFSPSLQQIRKPPSELFAFSSIDNQSLSPKTKQKEGEFNFENGAQSIGVAPATPFGFSSSFPASLPRIRPREMKPNHACKNSDFIARAVYCDDRNTDFVGNTEYSSNNVRRGGAIIEGRDLFSANSTVDASSSPTSIMRKSECVSQNEECLVPKNNGETNCEDVKSPPPSFETKNLCFQPRSPKCLSGRYRSLDTSHDTSISSISVSSPLSPRYDNKNTPKAMSPLLSEGNGDAMSLSRSMEIETNDWKDEYNEKNVFIGDEVDFYSPGDSTNTCRKVSGTKLNFNALSPGVEIQHQSGETTPLRDDIVILKTTNSNDVTETYEPNCTESFPSIFSKNSMTSLGKDDSDHTDNMGAPFRTLNKKLNNSSMTKHDEFQYKLDSSMCSPIQCNEGSFSSTSPKDLTLGKEENERGENIISCQEKSNSCLSTSTASDKTRKLRPMPDISAFEVGRSGTRKSFVGNNRSSTSASATSPQHFLCPPTPIRTPVWAHNDSRTPIYSRQDSLISSKVLAACPPELLDGFSSFENSLGDDNINQSFLDQTPAKISNKNNHSMRFSQYENEGRTSAQKERKKFAKGRKGRFSTGAISSSFGLIYPPSTSKPNNSKSAFRRSSFPGRSSGEVGSTISFENDFENLGQLGSGNFAVVYKAKSRIDNCVYAIKKNRRQFRGKRDRENALAEVRMMQRLQASGKRLSDEKSKGFCPYLLLFIRAWQEGGYFFCQTELCCRDNCRSMMLSLSSEWHHAKKHYPSLERNLPQSPTPNNIESKGRLVPEQSIWKICHDVVAGLAHIHAHKVIHNDIKPSNIFFASHCRLGCICKIGDFGLAVDFDCIEDGHEGDTKYMPQELLSSNKKRPSADIFSLGLSLYELASECTFVLPAEGPRWHSIRNGESSLEIPSTRSHALIKLIKDMIHPNPNERPHATSILYGITKVKNVGNVYDKFLAEYVQDVEQHVRDIEREILAAQKEASLSRSTPTAGSLFRHDSYLSDISRNTRTPAEAKGFFSSEDKK